MDASGNGRHDHMSDAEERERQQDSLPRCCTDCVERFLEESPLLLVTVEMVLLHQAVQQRGTHPLVRDGSKKNSTASGNGLLERYNIVDRVKRRKENDDEGGSRAYPSRTQYGQRWEIAQKHGIDTGPLKFLGIPISGMMYYMNWVLTNAQIELLTADVSVIDYGRTKKNRKKYDFDDTDADENQVKKAGQDWIERYGTEEGAGTNLTLNDIFRGGNINADVGVKLG